MPENFRPNRIWHGGDYNPEQWPDDIRREDVSLMREAGINSVTLGVFSWAVSEPKRGVFNWEWLDRTFERMHEAEIDVILATPSSAPPRWLATEHPEIMLAEPNGVRRQPGWRQQFCPSSPVYRAEVSRFETLLAQRYGQHPAFKLWHISNELGRACWCEVCVSTFRKWLEVRYGDLETLNTTWWTAFWSNRYSAWEEIVAPRPHLHPNGPTALQLDWKRFQSAQVVDFFRAEIAAVRAITPDLPVTTNLMGFWDKLDYAHIADHCDVVSYDHYPPVGGDPAQEAIAHSLIRGLGHGRHWLLMEQTPSASSWTPSPRLQPPGHLRRQTWMAIAHGSDSVLYFQWRRSRGDCEKFHGAIIEHAGSSDARVFREVAQLGEELARLAPQLLATTVPRARIGILYDWENRWAQESSNPPGRNAFYIETLTKHFSAIWQQNLAVDIVRFDADWSGYDLLIGPQLYQLPTGKFPINQPRENLAKKITTWIESGGTFVLTHFSGIVDESDLAFANGYPGPLRETFGIWVEEFDVAPAAELQNSVVPNEAGKTYLGCGPYLSHRHCDRIRLEGAETLAIYGEGWYRGEPCITQRKFGKGLAIYLGTDIDAAGLHALYQALTLMLGFTPMASEQGGIEFRERLDGNGRRFVIVLNHSHKPVDVVLGTLAGIDHCTGKRAETNLSMAAHGVAFLEIQKP